MQSDFTADHGALLDHLDEYHRVRGWRARCVYLTLMERRTLLLDPTTTGACFSSGALVLDGAEVRTVKYPYVAARIREWNVQP